MDPVIIDRNVDDEAKNTAIDLAIDYFAAAGLCATRNRKDISKDEADSLLVRAVTAYHIVRDPEIARGKPSPAETERAFEALSEHRRGVQPWTPKE